MLFVEIGVTTGAKLWGREGAVETLKLSGVSCVSDYGCSGAAVARKEMKFGKVFFAK